MKKLPLVFLCSAVFLSACQNSSHRARMEEEQKMYILETTRNYGGLVEIYRNRLKVNTNDIDSRLKLANLYYLMNDSDSSLYYLKPLLKKDNGLVKQDSYYLLYARNLIRLGDIDSARSAIDTAVSLNPNNGEAYNVLGITQVRQGQLDAAEISFNQARALFYDDKKVINNLAMVSILSKNYRKAYAYLSQLYNKGQKDPIILNNMLYTIVKLGDNKFARQFCIDNKLSTQPEILINELQRIDPKDAINFKFLAPNIMDVKAEHSTELAKINDKPVIATTKVIDSPKTASSVLGQIKPMTDKTSEVNNSTLVTVATKITNSVIATRMGEHKGYTRLVIETKDKLAVTVKKLGDVQYEIILPATSFDERTVARLEKQILNNDRNFTSGRIYKDDKGNTVIRILTKQVIRIKQSYVAPYGKYKHNSVVDFII